MSDQNEQNEHSPTMPPAQGPLSSKGFVDFGVQVGQYVIHRGPTEWLLDHVPDKLAGPLRQLVAKGIREFGKHVMTPETELQEAMNRKLFMNTFDAETGQPLMAEVQGDYIKDLFPHGKPEQWPTQLVICTKDVRPDPALLRRTMLYFPEIAGDILQQPLDVVTGFDEKTAGRVVVIGSYNTDKDIMHNASTVLERTQEVKRHPDSIKGISDAAVKAGESLLDAMTLRQEHGATVLRVDSADIMRHVMVHGYSQGGNIATDIFRYIRSELMSGRYELAQDARGDRTTNAADAKQVAALLGNSYVYTIAAAEVPYHESDLATLPPRDNSRSDGDLVISAAVGTLSKQSNFHSTWQQGAPDTQRNDRLLKTTGPKKRLFGLGEPRGEGYHAMLGHGDDDYRHSVVEEGGELLKERLAPRFLGKVVASDITFRDGHITLDFERGTPPAAMRHARNALAGKLKAEGFTLHKSGNYRLRFDAMGNAPTLDSLRNVMDACAIESGQNVDIALHPQQVSAWLEQRLKKLPDVQIRMDATEKGPVLHILPAGFTDAAGTQVQSLLRRGLERAGIRTKRAESDTVEVPLQDAVEAFKQYHTREQGAGYAR